jgi:hypothetical protein
MAAIAISDSERGHASAEQSQAAWHCAAEAFFPSSLTSVERCQHRKGMARTISAFPNLGCGCNFHKRVQAEHPEASRTKQVFPCPTPRNLKPITAT